jgi:hypothetical protein
MQGLCTIMHTSFLCRFSSSMQRPRTPTQVYTSFYDTRLLLVVPTAEDNFMHVPCSFYADLCELCNLDIYLCSSCQSRCTWPHFASANASAAALGRRAAAAVGARPGDSEGSMAPVGTSRKVCWYETRVYSLSPAHFLLLLAPFRQWHFKSQLSPTVTGPVRDCECSLCHEEANYGIGE